MCVHMCVCVCLSECGCMCVHAYVYVCINVTGQNNVEVATCKTQHQVTTQNAITFPRRLKCCINQNSHENAFLYALPFNSFMPSGDIRSYKLKQTCS